MLKEITTFIESQAGLTRDTNLFAGHRPQGTIDACDVVLETAGGSVFFNWAKRADLVIQVLSRAKSYFTARARAWAIYDAIYREHTVPDGLGTVHPSAGWRLPLDAEEVDKTYEIMIIEPLAPPQYIGQDEKLRHEFSTNYLMKIVKL